MTNHSNRTIANVNRVIRRHLAAAGYDKAQADHGIAYARSKGNYSARDGYILAISRILYDDAQLENGALFEVEAGHGPR